MRPAGNRQGGQQEVGSEGRKAKTAVLPAGGQPLSGSPFGDSILDRCAIRPASRIELKDSLEELRKRIPGAAPVCPGVYGWLNEDGIIIYIGKAKSLRHRLTGYFANQTADPKMERIRRHSTRLIWEPVSHELLALIREQELIERFRPAWNVAGKPERRQPGFICLGKGAAPGIFFSRAFPEGAGHVVGPFAGRGEMREAVETMNYVFQLRDCPDKTRMRFSNQLQLFEQEHTAGCLRFELSTCPGPCAGACSRTDYERNVDEARKFLERGNAAVGKRLEERFQAAVNGLQFERAAVLFRQLRDIKWMERRIRQVIKARKTLNGLWVLPGFDHQHHAMILRRGLLVGSAGVPRQGKPAGEFRERIERAAALDESLPSTSLATSWFLILESWSRRFPEDANTVVPFDHAMSVEKLQKACA
jgi:excinuclease ABC subunit C